MKELTFNQHLKRDLDVYYKRKVATEHVSDVIEGIIGISPRQKEMDIWFYQLGPEYHIYNFGSRYENTRKWRVEKQGEPLNCEDEIEVDQFVGTLLRKKQEFDRIENE